MKCLPCDFLLGSFSFQKEKEQKKRTPPPEGAEPEKENIFWPFATFAACFSFWKQPFATFAAYFSF